MHGSDKRLHFVREQHSLVFFLNRAAHLSAYVTSDDDHRTQHVPFFKRVCTISTSVSRFRHTAEVSREVHMLLRLQGRNESISLSPSVVFGIFFSEHQETKSATELENRFSPSLSLHERCSPFAPPTNIASLLRDLCNNSTNPTAATRSGRYSESSTVVEKAARFISAHVASSSFFSIRIAFWPHCFVRTRWQRK